jgi:hypothetical protein
MDIKPALKSQYHAGLKTVRLCVEACPEDRWADPRDGYTAFWRAAYHTLFFTYMYLHAGIDAFQQWPNHKEEAEDLGPFNGPDGQVPKPATPYTKRELLEFWAVVDAFVDPAVDAIDLGASDCGFPWYKNMGKLEHQFVNLRHIQHHAGALCSRLRIANEILIPWVGRGPTA